MIWVSMGVMAILLTIGIWRSYNYCKNKQGWQRKLWIVPLVILIIGIAVGLVSGGVNG